MARALSAADVRRALATFSARDLARGRAYYAEGRVGVMKPALLVENELLFTLEVRGSARQPYTSSLVFSASSGKLLDSECTCPLEGFCKHAVAALEALGDHLAGSPQGVSPTARAARLNPALENWLTSLTHAVLPPEVPRAASSERLLFCIRIEPVHGDTNRLHLHLERAVLQPDGSYRERRRVGPAAVDWLRDPAVSPGDRELVVRLGDLRLTEWVLEWTGHGAWLSEAVATDRAFLMQGNAWTKLAAGAPRVGELSFTSDARGWQLPRLSGPGFTHVFPFVPPLYLDAPSGVLGVIDVPGIPAPFAQAWHRGATVSPVDAAEVARRLAIAIPHLSPPSPLVRALRTVKADPVMILRLESRLEEPPAPTPWGSVLPPPARPWVRIRFDYAGERVDPMDASHERVTEAEILSVARAYDAEDDLFGQLDRVGFVAVERAFSGRALPRGVCFSIPKISPFEVTSRAEALASSQVRIERAPDYAFDAVAVDDLEVGLEELPESIDHFAVTLGIRVGDETFAALPLVMAALRERAPTADESLLVALPDGRTASIPAARLLPLRLLLTELLAQKNPGLVPRSRAVAIDPAVLARSPASLAKLREALASPRKVAVPKTLKATLRGYQREGFSWLMARRHAHLGAVLADDMGLGKTVQTLALLLSEDRSGVPSLVVCPKSVLGNWQAETQRFAPSLKVHVHQGADRATRAHALPDADLVLTTYPILVRDAALFAAQRFATVVLDEAQTIKTASSTFTHAACALRGDFRLALSGTPMENHLGELWSVMRFALPELLGDSRSFTSSFRRPIERDGAEAPRRALVARLAPFVLRRRKEQVASELPPKTIVIEPIVLDDAQRDVYETVRASMDARVKQALLERGIAQSHIIVLDALLKLRQAVCDPRLLPMKTAKNVRSAKLTALVGKLRELADEGRRVLVFSQFVAMLELIQTELRREKIPFLVLTGETENRADVVAEFQRGNVPVFLLSLKAGGTGLNLTAADVVIHYDPWWNPAAEAQATDRAHRIGQERPVLVYKLVGKETIEEKILALQEKKQALFTSIMDDGAGATKKLTAEDVEFLFAR